MASVLEGLMPTRRKRSRSRSESGKQLHARWGDNSISAPNGVGWSQQYLEDDLSSPDYQTVHGSPDSSKTLVNNSPDLGYDCIRDKIENLLQAVESQKFAGVPIIKEVDGQITITFALGPSENKTYRRPSIDSKLSYQSHQPEQLPGTRPLFPPISTNIDEVITVEARDAVDPGRTTSPIVHTQSPVYDDVSTFFTRAAFPEKSFGNARLPHIQTNVPQNKSQPASAMSIGILSPVQEQFNGLSESTGATPMGNTPIATHLIASIPPIPSVADELADIESLTQRLEKFRKDPPSAPISRITSPIDTSDSDFEPPSRSRGPSRSASRGPGVSRPSSRGPGIGEVAYMRASSRGPADQPQSRSESRRRERSISRDPVRRAHSVEPVERSHSVEPVRRAMSREPAIRRPESRGREDGGRRSRSQSRGEPKAYRTESVGEPRYRAESVGEVRARRAESIGEQKYRRAESIERHFRHVEIYDPNEDRGPRDATPSGFERERGPRGATPVGFERDRGPRGATPVGYERDRGPREGTPIGYDRGPREGTPIGYDRDRGTRDATPIGFERTTTPSQYHKRSFSRDHFDLVGRRTASPSAMSRRAASRGPLDSRRISMDFTRRAMSVDPVRRNATPQEDFTPISRRGTPLAFQNGRFVPMEASDQDSSADEHEPGGSPTSGEETGIDTDATDIETETDDAYYESRKEWNGKAANGADGKGYYGDVADEYKAIAKDVEADQATAPPKMEKQVGINIGGLKLSVTKVKTDKSEKEREKEARKERDKEKDGARKYVGPDLVPSTEEVWG